MFVSSRNRKRKRSNIGEHQYRVVKISAGYLSFGNRTMNVYSPTLPFP